MMRRRAILIGTMLAPAGLALAQAATRWVQRTKVDIRAGRGSYFEVVDTVVQGEQVQVVRSEERWLFVRTPRQKTGWIFEAALSEKPVGSGSSSFLKLVPGDASTSATAASTGAKGIYAEKYAKDKGYDFGVVTWIEENQPTAAEVETFIREGGLRPAGGAGGRG